MAVITRLRACLRSRRGSSAVEFIATAAMLILTFAILVSAMIYVTQYYNASYIARRVVRTIEVTGEYDEQTVNALANGLGGSAMEDLNITAEANWIQGRRVQLRDTFRVTLSAAYPIRILQFGGRGVELRLPISVRLSGRSEVFWK